MTVTTVTQKYVSAAWNKALDVLLARDNQNASVFQILNPLAHLWRGTIAPDASRTYTNSFGHQQTNSKGSHLTLAVLLPAVYTILASIADSKYSEDTVTKQAENLSSFASTPWQDKNSKAFLVRGKSPVFGVDSTTWVAFTDSTQTGVGSNDETITYQCRDVFLQSAKKLAGTNSYADLVPGVPFENQMTRTGSTCTPAPL